MYVKIMMAERVMFHHVADSHAIDHRYQAQGLGKALLRDAILRVLQAAEIAGIKAIIVHALSDEAKQFYEDYGFIAFKDQPMTLALPIEGLA